MAADEDLTDASVRELLARLPADLSALIHQEVRLAQAELGMKARHAALGGALLAAAAVTGGMSAAAATVWLVRLLGRHLPPAAATALTSVLLGGVSGALATRGLSAIRQTWPPVPEQAIAVAEGGGR